MPNLPKHAIKLWITLFQLLIDRTTDVGNQEDELIVLLYCSKDGTTQEITPCTRYLSIHSPGKADANGFLSCVSKALKLMGVENVLDRDSVIGVEGRPVLVGGGTAGASVNVGDHTGLKAQMQQTLHILLRRNGLKAVNNE